MSYTDVLTPPGPPTADVSAPVVPDPVAVAAPELAAEPAPAPTRREPSGPVLVPFDSALPGVSSADIRAELARRGKRVPKLLAERAQVLQQMETIEDALEFIGEDVPAT